MAKMSVRSGRQSWACGRVCCNPAKYERFRRYRKSELGGEKIRETMRKWAKNRYWSDPWAPLLQQQQTRDWRAKKREEKLRGR